MNEKKLEKAKIMTTDFYAWAKHVFYDGENPMKTEESQQGEVKLVQCDHCKAYENPDVADTQMLCGACQNKLEHYDRFLLALRSIFAGTSLDGIHKDAEAALKYCGEQP